LRFPPQEIFFNMPDFMNPPSLEQVLKIILNSFDTNQEIFDIPEKLFYKHWHYHVLYTEKYGKKIHNSIGISSGPLTQLAQNIVSGWLCGARFLDLKTVQPNQITDRTKPSIDIFDGSYNCEKSHELTVEQAYDQYLNAWIIIHVLNHKLNPDQYKNQEIGTIFNMSLGYTLADIRSDKMQWFVDKMINCSVEKEEKIKLIKKIYPAISKIKIPDQISNSFTVNTCKGCSARELEYICKFLIIDKKLHPGLKFSPKLLGYKSVMAILNAENTFNAEVNPEDFENSIQYGEAITLIKNISETANELGLELTVKISNSLACKNNTGQIPGTAEEVYLSGRALHPIAVNLAAKFQSKFEGQLDISFSGGANCFNVVNLMQSGFSSITTCTDLLKPGGYGRLNQYFTELSKSFTNFQAKSIREFILKSGNEYNVKDAAIENLRNYAIRTLSDQAYQKTDVSGISIKSKKPLPFYDCIVAPCREANPLNTDTAGYCWHTHKNDAEKAIATILSENPLPSIMGMIGDDSSRKICTRNNYDYPIRMKDLERFITEFEPEEIKGLTKLSDNKRSVAVVGSGISGLTCAWYLSMYGFRVDVYEREQDPGGMATTIIPGFRISDAAIQKDIQRIKKSGVKFLSNTEIDKERFDRIRKSYDFVYVATGASDIPKMGIEGDKAEGVINPLVFLREAKFNENYQPGKNIAVIGDDWIAADAARAAIRLVGEDGYVSLMTLGGQDDLKLDKETVNAIIEEEIEIFDHCRPVKFILADGKISSIEIVDVEVNLKSRAKKVAYKDIKDSEQSFKFDAVIPCTGRIPTVGFTDIKKLKITEGSYATKLENVYAGGAVTNPDISVMNAVLDAKLAAREIAETSGIKVPDTLFAGKKNVNLQQLKVKRAQVEKPNNPEVVPVEKRVDSKPIVKTLKPVSALREAARCLQCDVLCNVCVGVCPNKAMVGFEVDTKHLKIPTVTLNGEEFFVSFPNKLPIVQKHQILVVTDWCNDCGNCTTFCPFAGQPHKDKLRLHFNHETFNKDENGLLVMRNEKYFDITLKNKGNLAQLTENWDAYIFENDDCMAVLEKETFNIQQITIFDDDIQILEIPEIAEINMLFKTVTGLV